MFFFFLIPRSRLYSWFVGFLLNAVGGKTEQSQVKVGADVLRVGRAGRFLSCDRA